MKVISAFCLFLFSLVVTSAAPVPYSGKVAINGAVELAKEFGGEKSFGFVNAVLDRIWKEEASTEASNPDEG